MQWKHINGLKLKLKLIFILFKVCFVFSLVQAEELKDFRPEMPAWLQERPSSSKSEDTNAFHPSRPYKWWNAKQMRDTQRVLFGIIYDEKVQRRSMEVSKERWKQSSQTAKNCSIHRCGDWWGNLLCFWFFGEWWVLSWYGPNHPGKWILKNTVRLFRHGWFHSTRANPQINRMLSIQKSTSIGRNSEYEEISSKSSKWLNRKGEQEWDNTPASSMIPNPRLQKTVPSQNAVSKHVQIFARKIYHLRNLNCMDWRSFIYK